MIIVDLLCAWIEAITAVESASKLMVVLRIFSLPFILLLWVIIFPFYMLFDFINDRFFDSSLFTDYLTGMTILLLVVVYPYHIISYEREAHKEWIVKNLKKHCFVFYDEEVYFMNSADAMAFKLVWEE